MMTTATIIKGSNNKVGTTTSISTTTARIRMMTVLLLSLILIGGLLVVVSYDDDDSIATRILQEQQEEREPYAKKTTTLPSSTLQQSPKGTTTDQTNRRRLTSANNNNNNNNVTAAHGHSQGSKQRLLYIITSSSPTYYVEGPITLEDGTIIQNTERDRLNDIVFPIIVDAVESFISSNQYSIVDVYMITSYEFTKEKYQSITTQLQDFKKSTTYNYNFDVGFQVWDNAMPMDYSCRFVKDPTTGKKDSIRKCYDSTHRLSSPSNAKLQELGAQLARQHRYVVKDKFPYYDFFVVYEDDMFITQAQVSNHQSVMKQLRHLEQHILKNGNSGSGSGVISTISQKLQQQLTNSQLGDDDDEKENYEFLNDDNNIMLQHLERLRPGLIRVEVLPQDISKQRIQQQLDPIPLSTSTITYNNNNNITSSSSSSSFMVGGVDAEPCCHMKHALPTVNNNNTKPKGNELMIWETGILGMSVRKMPSSSSSSLGWVGLLPGPVSGRHLPGYKAMNYKGLVPSQTGGGEQNDPNLEGESKSIVKKNKKRVPDGSGDPRYLAQSAGWMASPRELMELHTRLCDGGFLPPYDESRRFQRDGLHRHNVEFWSGGIQMWCGFCNIQRIVSLDPKHFSKHLIYHTANNKQKKLPDERLVRVTDLFGQLHTLKEEASIVMASIAAAAASASASGTNT